MDNAEIYRTLSRELFEEGKLDTLDRHLHRDYQVSDPSFDRGKGIAGLKRSMGALIEAFSDIKYEVLRQVASGDWVTTHFRFNATNRKPFLGLSKPGARISAEGMSMNRFAGGKMIEGHVVWDLHSVAQQLGGKK